MDKEKKIIEIRKVLLKHTNEVDNWNDAIFEQDFDELVDDLFALHDVSKSVTCEVCDGWGYTVDVYGRRDKHCTNCE